MATKTIAWESGGGYITLTYTGVGNAPISVKSDANESFDERQQTVRIATTAGSPSRAVELLVKQKGKTLPAGTVYNYSYTGSVQQVTLPAGRYKLQCWGAQGGNSDSYSGVGSKGGYSEGVLTLTQTTTLYIFVGGKGSNGSSSSVVNGGWNGGGGSVGRSSYNSGDEYGISYPACGGGATDIATVTSGMSYSSYRTNRSNASLLSRCIVAGGGAGASARYTEETITTSNEVKLANVPSSYHKKIEVSSIGAIFYYYIDNIPIEEGKTYYLDGNFPSYMVPVLKATTVADVGQISPPAKESTSKSITTGTDHKYLHLFVAVYNNDKTPPVSLDGCYIYYTESTTSTDTSSSKSTSSQQGGGTSGRGTSPGTQNGGGGDFGAGANQTTTNYRYASGAGGGGWYGGGTARSDSSTDYINRSGGGSGFVNTAANASYRPSGYTGLQLDSGTTKDGSTSFPAPGGGNETGHSGNGYARITVL